MRIAVFSGRPHGRGTISGTVSQQGSIVLSQTDISRSAVEGSTAPIVVGLQVSNGGPGALSSVSLGAPSQSWLTAEIDSASPPANILLTVDPTGLLVSGSPYSATVQVTAANASNSPLTITWEQAITAAAGGGVTSVDGVVQRWDGGTGSVLVTNGFPLPEGLLTEADVTARKFTVMVNGVEQAIWCESARGHHEDLSPRSLLFQFNYNIPDATPIPCQFLIGQVRTTTDLSAVTATRISNSFANTASEATATWKAAALPTDATYLCSTRLTFKPLMTLAAMQTADPAGYAFFKTAWDIHWNYIKNLEIANGISQSGYEKIDALLTHYCMTGDPFWWWEAMRRAYWMGVDYNGAMTTTTGYTPNPNVFMETEYHGGGIATPEWQSQVYYGFASAYLASGYATWWAIVNTRAQFGTSAAWTAQAAVSAYNTGVFNDHYGPRFNTMRVQPVIAAYLIDATRKIQTPSFGNLFIDFPTHLPRCVQAYADHPYAKGDYRDGMTVGNTDCTDMSAQLGYQSGDFPVFQANLPAMDLITYYLNVKADAAIPAMVKGIVDAVLQNVVTLATNVGGSGLNDTGYNLAAVGTTYGMNATAGRDLPTTSFNENYWRAAPYTLPEVVTGVAFLANFYPLEVVNGNTYAQWYAIVVDPDNTNASFLTWSWKLFGQLYGRHQGAPSLMIDGLPTLPSTIRTPTNHTTWPP
jgi:hypothetical protein